MRVKLGDIFEIGSGGTPSKSHPEYYGGDIPWVKTGDLKNEYLYEVEDFITEEGLKNSAAKVYEADTVLIAMYGATIGATSILKINACTNQACAAIKKNEQVIPEYLYYFLRSKKKKFVKDGVGGAQPNISGNGHDGFCNTKRLGEFCKFQQGTQVPVEEQIEEQLEGYTRFLRIIDYTQAPQIPRYVSVKGRKIADDSVVIVRYGATAGFVGHGYAGILANNLFEVVPDESILSKDFLYLALKYGTFEQEVHDKAFGAAMPALSFGMMNDIGVVTPNVTAQNSFVDFVHQVNKSKFIDIINLLKILLFFKRGMYYGN